MDQAKGTHAQRALTLLRQRILNGALPGGTRLYEVALAEELGISRTPIRDALARLAVESLLDRVPAGGFVVRSFAVSDVVDTIELRGVLEGTAARFAAERGVAPTALAEAQETLTGLDGLFTAQELDIEAYSQLNTAFHDLLAQMAQSDVLLREIARVKALPYAAPSAFLDDQAQVAALTRTLSHAQEQHRAILDAITRREGARAEALAREHARAARRNVEVLLGSRPMYT
ncbi:GntR family transcriptional regulator [Neotabrizicola shimadae]|uniref:GntR family transcriptional regulator n=1 Tax=Neotabrizicola shimadae TaxID=2807096 RepID=A0A8G0ZUD7_9RHOB|nr:GntR family transcriptional regulator [Neotabrizicola shimadae]QYZ69620.1 GntR family transcriptional regulator [Neotabrizicola shimadae]